MRRGDFHAGNGTGLKHEVINFYQKVRVLTATTIAGDG
jgi:hypothetical protein